MAKSQTTDCNLHIVLTLNPILSFLPDGSDAEFEIHPVNTPWLMALRCGM